MGDFGPIPRERRSGEERFREGEKDLDFDLLSFWQWSASDVVSNATRGILAEYLVARAIGAVGATNGVRDEWATYDLKDQSGNTIEVKSAAYLQSWYQKELSWISFNCGKTVAWDPATNEQGTERCRHTDVYVFALLKHKDKATVNPLDVSQWEFYVVPTVEIDCRERSQSSITLPSLQKLHGPPVGYFELAQAVARAADVHRAPPKAEVKVEAAPSP